MEETPLDITAWLDSGACISLSQELLLLGWGKRTWSPRPQPSGTFFYAPSFFLEDLHPWFHHEHYATVPLNTLRDLLTTLPQSITPKPIWDPLDASPFVAAFHGMQPLFSAQKLFKTVPYACRKAHHNYDAPQRVHSILSLLQNQQRFSTYIYGFWDDTHGMLGSTPELLFSSTQKGVLTTMACAGSQERSLPRELLLNDTKSAEEHARVVEGIQQSLAHYGKVILGERTTVELPRMRHLVTPIELCHSGDIDFEAIVKALHPTPALGAYPRDVGSLWLREYNELVPRGRFGAPFGCFNATQRASHCYVAIRNVQWDLNGMAVLAGCGVVPSSILEDEVKELHLKIAATIDSLS